MHPNFYGKQAEDVCFTMNGFAVHIPLYHNAG